VQVHETFENKPSSTYTVTDVFFRSIETWLDGNCRPRTFQWGPLAPPARAALLGGKFPAKSAFTDDKTAQDSDDGTERVNNDDTGSCNADASAVGGG